MMLLTTFEALSIGDEFITTCNEIATKIEPIVDGGKLLNARRTSGKAIYMADWEPVFTEEGPDFYQFYWECPECEKAIHISVDECECEESADD